MYRIRKGRQYKLIQKKL